jgi:hypothetical protein
MGFYLFLLFSSEDHIGCQMISIFNISINRSIASFGSHEEGTKEQYEYKKEKMILTLG